MDTLKLKGVRVKCGYTQEQLAQEIGITAKTYNRKELGITEFSRDEILIIIEKLFLDIHMVNEIFFGNQITDCIIKN
jgi:DNA-binding XRE family transcriptional regulator